MIIDAHCLVVNEERWIWYSLMSILPYVDRVVVWDTGSSDDTVSIIKSISNPKIVFKQYGLVDKQSFTQARQAMLTASDADWVILVDGDEVWPDQAIKNTVDLMRKSGSQYEYLVSCF